METSSSQYGSFLFWRQPIPALDLSELQDLGLTDGPAASSSMVKDKKSKYDEVRGGGAKGAPERDGRPLSDSWSLCRQEELAEFSSFNYWRAPIADVDALLADLNLLL